MNDFNDATTASPELAAAIEAGIYQALVEAAPRLIATIGKLHAEGATWADIELRIATWLPLAGDSEMRLWLDSAMRHMGRMEQHETIVGIWFTSEPDLEGDSHGQRTDSTGT